MSPGVTYYVRAYATNGAGTAYGNERSFTTLNFATLTTRVASSIKAFTATSGGDISSNGGSAVTARGVCWSIYSNPTIADPKTSDGTGNGGFPSAITGLYPQTIFYVRAYATNAAGTAYGSQVSFTTANFAVGDPYQGGIIAYILQPSDPDYVIGVPDGFIAAATDQSAGIQWGCYGEDVGGPGTAERPNRGGGLDNTNEIVSWPCGTGGAADLANNPRNGYNDWYLPSRDELGLMYFNRTAIGGFALADYWSSTEYESPLSEDYANYMDFVSGWPSADLKNELKRVRAIRNFLTLGDSYGGGIIAYIFKPGDAGYVIGETHGLIMSSANLGAGTSWGCSGTTISGADGTAIGTGNQNTTDITTGCVTPGIAAKLCADYASSGFTDWYLPSKDELSKIYDSRTYMGGYSTTYYWSSSEFNSTDAWALNFGTGVAANVAKNFPTYRVRAVRNF